jgi:pSer/pThr/pTyr-binding forkhead associated (FHA) protein
MASQRVVIEPGSTLTVGRTDRAGFALPQDEEMSGLHLELAWDGTTCLLRDLKSAKGTFVDGIQASSSKVANGSWIRAGMTDFSLYIEESTPPPKGSFDTSPEAQVRAHRVLEDLRANAQGASLFAVLDSVQDDRVVQLLRESVETYRSLFEGLQGAIWEDAAPYLVHLPANSRLLERLVWEGWAKSWGVYLVCRRPLADIRRHFRKILFVKEEDTRKEMYFRFYDPRVLRVFLPSCTARQTEEMFGEIAMYLAEGEHGEVLRFTGGEAS